MHLVTIIAMLIIDASIMVTKNAMNVHDEHVKHRTHISRWKGGYIHKCHNILYKVLQSMIFK